MSQSSASDWEAGTVLHIFTPTDDIACAGVTQAGNPCGWRLEGGDKADARELLAEMSEKSPNAALDDLPELARLVLCRKNHQNQAGRVISRWKRAINTYISEADRATEDVTEVSNSSETYNDIIADLSRLRITPAQLRTIVDEHISERRQEPVSNGSARSTPPRSTPSFPRPEPSAEPSRSKMIKLKFFK